MTLAETVAQGEGHGTLSILSADEGPEATAEDDKEPRVSLPVKKEEEGVPAEPGGPAQGGPAGEPASAQGEPGAEAEAGGEGGEAALACWAGSCIATRTLEPDQGLSRAQPDVEPGSCLTEPPVSGCFLFRAASRRAAGGRCASWPSCSSSPSASDPSGTPAPSTLVLLWVRVSQP